MQDTSLAGRKQSTAQDERVTFTLRNWTGRFLRNEVNYGDFQKIGAAIRTWDDWLPAWSDKAREYERLAAEADARQAKHTAAEAWRRAAFCWHFGKFNWFVDLDKHEHAQRRLNHCYERALWSLSPPGLKADIPYGGVHMAAILRRPTASGRRPVVILIGGLDSVKEELQIVADYFLARGMATLAIDGPGQGETAAQLKIEHASEKPIGAAIDFLERTEGVDASRLGIYGQSLGGYYAIRGAAFEPRIKAAVGSGGPYAVAGHWTQLPPMTRSGYQYRTGASDPNDALARVRKLDLTDVVDKVTANLLIMHGSADEVVPVEDAERVAREAKHVTFWRFEGGNHSLSNKHFEARNGMADWMAKQLGGEL
jgi:2,6-dihydroxypseudooxynicotine hydrolase